MGWLDANELQVMTVAAQDRLEELRSSADPVSASTRGAGDAPGEHPACGPARAPSDAIDICRGRRSPCRLGVPGLAC
jgi:hypothetical protein